MTALLAELVTEWVCPNCDVRETTRGLVSNRMHTCAGLHMLVAPLVREGTRCRVTARERQDYLAGEIQRTGDDGRPYCAVETIRDEGTDVVAFAPLAQGSARDLL